MKKNLRHFDRERLIWDAYIEPKHKLILLAYNSFLGANDTCWPSNQVIAALTGIPKSTLIRDLHEMRNKQLIISNPRFLKNKPRSPDKKPPQSKPQSSNETVINWPMLETLSGKPHKTAPQSQNETAPQSQNETAPQSQNETAPQSQNETRSNL